MLDLSQTDPIYCINRYSKEKVVLREKNGERPRKKYGIYCHCVSQVYLTARHKSACLGVC